MGWVLVIEENQSVLTELSEAVALTDSKAVLVSFPDSHSFLKWMDGVQAQNPELDPPLPKDKFLGFITALESWKFKDVRLIGKFKALFIQRGFAKSEDEIFAIFTTYDSPQFQKKRFEYRSVNNVVFKPFDKLILQQMLSTAFMGRKALKNKFTHTLKARSDIEMLKQVKLVGVGELSFQTHSPVEIQVGSMAKYYADFLETRQHRSALAQVLSYSNPQGGEFGIAELRFFALDQAQSFNIQKLAQKDRQRRELSYVTSVSPEYEFIFLRKAESSLCDEVRPSFERFFDHKVTTVDSLSDLNAALMERDTNAVKRFIFVDHGHVAGNEIEEIDTLLNAHTTKNIGICLLCPRILAEPLEWELSSRIEDIFYSPFNRSYIVKSLKKKWPGLIAKEELFESHHDTEQTIHVSGSVKLVEVSEAGLVIEYHRPITLGSFREFHFTMPDETEVPELLAQCNFSAPGTDKKIFLNHFVFFGLRDHELKFIRRWMLNYYVEEKQKAEAGG